MCAAKFCILIFTSSMDIALNSHTHTHIGSASPADYFRMFLPLGAGAPVQICGTLNPQGLYKQLLFSGGLLSLDKQFSNQSIYRWRVQRWAQSRKQVINILAWYLVSITTQHWTYYITSTMQERVVWLPGLAWYWP